MKKTVLKITAILCLALAAALCGCDFSGIIIQDGTAKTKAPNTSAPRAPDAPFLLPAVYSIEKASISWYTVLNADGFKVYRSTSPEGPYEKVAELQGYTYSVPGLPLKTTYYYKVSAYKLNPNNGKHIESELSEYIKVTMPDLRYPPDEVSVTFKNPDGARVEWYTDYDDVEYRVYRNSGPMGTTSELFYEDTGLSFGRVYEYTVAIVTADGEGPQSPAASLNTLQAFPVINAKVTYWTGSADVHVSWERLKGANSYNVYRSTSENGPYNLIGAGKTIDFIQYEYTDTGFALSAFCYYKVSAVDYLGEEGELSEYAVIFIQEGAPIGVTAEFIEGSHYTDDYIKIDWDPYPNAAEYRLYRNPSYSSIYTCVGTPSTNTWNDTSVGAPGSIYLYKVTAVVDGYESEMSSFARVVNTRSVPSVPSNPSGSTGQLDAPGGVKIDYIPVPLLFNPKISWNSVKGAKTYEVYRKDLVLGIELPMVKTAFLSFIDLSALLAGKYEYWVVAVDEKGEKGKKSGSVYYPK
jgi:fibronectin type 3 domain-containing protein